MSELSYLEKLLDGTEVVWKTLDDISVKISSGGTPKTGVAEYYDGDIPWLRTQEVNFCDIWDTGVKITESGVKNSSAKWIPVNCVIIAMYGATVGKLGINKIPMTTNQACANIEVNSEIADYKYVFYFLSSQYQYIKSLGSGSQTNINAGIVKKLLVPIPCPDTPEKSLAIQAEIVRVLDKFTALTAELTAELTMRKNQYNYYRDQLLSFKEGNVAWKTLGEISRKISSGGTPKTGVTEYYDGTIPWLRTQEVDFREIWDTEIKITEEGLKTSSAKWIPKDCIIIAMYGATVGKIGINKIPMTTNQACANIQLDEEIVHYRYVFHFLCSQYAYIKSLGTGSQTNINAQIVKNIKIPVPFAENPEKSLNEQLRIVNILDKFDTLTSSITEGLPREIELRQKQYEYYRDLLFSFPKHETTSN
ncbi:restriction endonuclease subunit S [Enterobacter roggenkampii]|uniref:restriction endonuclease subunit S n=1 Tax=Enterobacter roggenkampii TaxID=1812935 RepID=UPI00321B99F3